VNTPKNERRIVITGASRGLGRALREGIARENDHFFTFSRSQPTKGASLVGKESWVKVDLEDINTLASTVNEAVPNEIDVAICNVGIWEESAFTPEYNFASERDQSIDRIIKTNVTSTIVVLKALLPKLLSGAPGKIVLIGSTSGLARSGRPEVAFGATKFAINGIADALREGYRDRRLAVTCIHLGYLNTEDGMEVPEKIAADRDAGKTIPVHDVVKVIGASLELTGASFVREIVMPAILDDRF
jgi:NAD(P)-dependent dehydrogenase (short-subunit alcohol dehydrogenase family)